MFSLPETGYKKGKGAYPMISFSDPSTLMHAVTDIGDSAVLGAVVLAAACYFIAAGCFAEAVAVALSFLLTSAAIGLLKVAFLSCGHDFLDIRSPSGHAALSVAVLGTFGLILHSLHKRWHRFLWPGLLGILGAAIVVTRIALGYHSFAEVAAGVVVGLCVLPAIWLFVLRRGRHSGHPRFNIYLLLAVTFAAIFLTYGERLPAEKNFNKIAAQIRAHFPVCREGQQ